MNSELLRLIDSIHRDKGIDVEILFTGIEDAILSAARKHYGPEESLLVDLDRETGAIRVMDGDEELDLAEFGRIAAQAAKQVIVQKIKEAETDIIFNEFEQCLRSIVSGTVQRVEGSNVIVNLGNRAEGLLPRREQVRGQTYRTGDRIRCFILDVRREGARVRILLSRTHPDLVRRLFETEVPEIADGIIEIKVLAREAGTRTKIAVISSDAKVDCVGACVGVRGSRIKNIVGELDGEKIDIVRWSESSEQFIRNALNPAEVSTVHLLEELSRVKVIVPENQLSLAIGKRGQNVRLASKLGHWEIDVMTEEEAENRRRFTYEVLTQIPGIGETRAQEILELGYTIDDVAACDPQHLTILEGIGEQLALEIIQAARVALEQARQMAEEAEEASAEEAAVQAEATEPSAEEASAEEAAVQAEATEPSAEEASAEETVPETEAAEPSAEEASAEETAAETEATEPSEEAQAETEAEAEDEASPEAPDTPEDETPSESEPETESGA